MNKLELVRKLGKAVSMAKIDLALLALQKTAAKNNFLRAVVYHDTPPAVAGPLEKQLRFYQKHFSPVSKKDLDLFFKTGRWHKPQWGKPKPGLMITFDDGFKSNFDVALPLLEKTGFTGWFFIPSGLIGTPERMHWEEIRRLDQNHAIGCHTQSHLRMAEGLSQEILKKEIVDSKRDLEKGLGHSIDYFCWVGGELQTYTAQAHAAIKKAGYRYAFMTNSKPIGPKTDPFFLERTYVEPFWSVGEMTFMISGIIDFLYLGKRKRVARRLLPDDRLTPF